MMIILRLLHIVSGTVWVGAVVFLTFFLMPSVTAAGPGAGPFMKEFGQRKFPQVAMALMALTILSGLGLMGVSAASSDGAWFSSSMGRVISFGAAVTIVASVFGVLVNRPTAERMQKLAVEMQSAGGAPSASQVAAMQALQSRMSMASRVVTGLLLVALGAMATARYI
jgi:uncharacterized membrane protein